MHKQIIDYLTPMLGQETASNLLKHYCTRMRLSVDDLEPAHLPELARTIRPMLAVWLGSGGAVHVADEIAQLGRGVNAR